MTIPLDRSAKQRRSKLKWLLIIGPLLICGVVFLPIPSYREIDLLVPVEPTNVVDGVAIVDLPFKPLEVRLQGPKSNISKIDGVQLRYRLDLSNLGVGVHQLAVKAGKLQIPAGISIVSLKPALVQVVIDHKTAKLLPVKITLNGQPATGFAISGQRVTPSSAAFNGPESVLDTIREVETLPVDVSGLTASIKKEMTLNMGAYPDITPPPHPFVVEIFIEEKLETATFHHLSVSVLNTDLPYKITPESVSIEISGPATVLQKIAADRDIKILLDLGGLKPGIYVRRATINLPVKTSLTAVKPEIFTVKIDKP